MECLNFKFWQNSATECLANFVLMTLGESRTNFCDLRSSRERSKEQIRRVVRSASLIISEPLNPANIWSAILEELRTFQSEELNTMPGLNGVEAIHSMPWTS